MRNNTSQLEALSEKMDSMDAGIQMIGDSVSGIGNDTKELRRDLTASFGKYSFDYSWAENSAPLIAHAFGGIGSATYTNTKEAFLENYRQGHRVFEVDFFLSNPENALIAVHDEQTWRELTGNDTQAFTYENFMNSLTQDGHTMLDVRDVVELLRDYPDIYIVTDTKYTDRTSVLLEFSQLVYCAEQVDSTVLERVIPQIYNEEMLQWVMGVYPFRSVIYTLYQTFTSPEEVAEFCNETGVALVTVAKELLLLDEYAGKWGEKCLELWHDNGIRVATHTCNDEQEAQELWRTGVDLIYTDYIIPAVLN